MDRELVLSGPIFELTALSFEVACSNESLLSSLGCNAILGGVETIIVSNTPSDGALISYKVSARSAARISSIRFAPQRMHSRYR